MNHWYLILIAACIIELAIVVIVVSPFILSSKITKREEEQRGN